MRSFVPRDKVLQAYFIHGSDTGKYSGHGECLHVVFEHFFKTYRSGNRDKAKAFKNAHKALQGFFERENKRGALSLVKPKERPDIWGVKETMQWVMKCLRHLMTWMQDNQIVWVAEELPLTFDITHPEKGRIGFDLGRPDLIGYSALTRRTVIIDFKTLSRIPDDAVKPSAIKQLTKHALGLHLYFRKQIPPQHLLEVDIAALFFYVQRGSITMRIRHHQTISVWELFRRKGNDWRRKQRRYKLLLQHFKNALYTGRR